MTIASRLRQVLVLGIAWASLGGIAAAKGPKAERAADRAMNELFSSAKFEEAKDAIESAIAECAGCSKQTMALLHADLGIIFVTGFQDTKKGTAEMKKARALDPNVSLDPAFITPEVQAAFGAAGRGTAGPMEKEVVLEDEPEEHTKKRKPPPAEEAQRTECDFDDDCHGGKTCKAGACVTRPPRPTPPRERSVWLSLGLIQDAGFVSGSNLCTKNSQVNSGNTCLRASGSQYHGTPLPGSGGKLGLAPSLATTRLTLASYFALSSSVSGGLRVGYAFAGTAPAPDGGKKFFPLQAEIQAAYWLSQKALSTKHVGTFLEASGGIAQMVGHGSAEVHENTAAPRPISQLDNPPVQKLDVYQSSGQGFAGGGAGIFVPLGAGSALMVDLRLSAFFPVAGFALGLGAGVAFGP
jgi:hypothetical protein